MTEINVTMGVLPTEQIEAMLATLPKDSPFAVQLLAIKASRIAEEEAVRQVEAFGTSVQELTDLLPAPPKGVYNIFGKYVEVVEVVEDAPPEQVTIIKDGVTTTEMRLPTTKVWKWIIVVNHVCGGSKSASTTTTTDKPKRAISVYSKDSTNANGLKLIGHFRNGVEAAENLGFGVDARKVGVNAKRDVLVPKGYVVTDYDGTEFLVKK